MVIETQAELDRFTSECCSACGSKDNLRYSMWHGELPICRPCFMIWYDCPSDIDNTSPEAVGRESLRRKAANEWPYNEKTV